MDREPVSAPSRTDGASTRERLLDAAEELFAERGFAATSIRSVTQAVGVSISAANYHFGSKEDLLVATLRRRVDPVNRERIELLDKLEMRCGEAGPALEEILGAYLGPAFRITEEISDPGRRGQITGRLFSDPPDVVINVRRDLFGEVNRRFSGALQRALPACPRAEIELGLEFVVGIMLQVVGRYDQLLPERDTPSPSWGEVLERMVAFSASGLRSCAVAASTGARA